MLLTGMLRLKLSFFSERKGPNGYHLIVLYFIRILSLIDPLNLEELAAL